jgi:hypothetical protein
VLCRAESMSMENLNGGGDMGCIGLSRILSIARSSLMFVSRMTGGRCSRCGMQLSSVSGVWHLPKMALLDSNDWMMRASFLARALLEAEMDSDAKRLSRVVMCVGCVGAGTGNAIGGMVGVYLGDFSIGGSGVVVV